MVSWLHCCGLVTGQDVILVGAWGAHAVVARTQKDGKEGLQTRHTPHSHTPSDPFSPDEPCDLRAHSAVMSSKNYFINKGRALMIWL